jgi:hypothetical protein
MVADMNFKRRIRDVESDAEATHHVASRSEPAGVEIGLNAAIVAVIDDEPVVLVIRNEGDGGIDGLPFGPFSPVAHRTLESGLRTWVEEQTGLGLGYVEQLYTFGDRGRHAEPGDPMHVVSIGYLALTEAGHARDLSHGAWRSWYQYFPWEDWRKGKPDILAAEIEPRLRQWAATPALRSAPVRPVPKEDRLRICFGFDGGAWDEEKVLDRFELLYEAGLIEEARRDGREAVSAWGSALPRLGAPMKFDHRRILATAIGRVRAKIKYRPVIFELMPDDFTLFELQKTVEAILGPHLHKQNFRRLVESAGLVEPTGDVKTQTGGRPAKLFRFRREVVLERPAPGVRVKAVRT